MFVYEILHKNKIASLIVREKLHTGCISCVLLLNRISLTSLAFWARFYAFIRVNCTRLLSKKRSQGGSLIIEHWHTDLRYRSDLIFHSTEYFSCWHSRWIIPVEHVSRGDSTVPDDFTDVRVPFEQNRPAQDTSSTLHHYITGTAILKPANQRAVKSISERCIVGEGRKTKISNDKREP